MKFIFIPDFPVDRMDISVLALTSFTLEPMSEDYGFSTEMKASRWLIIRENTLSVFSLVRVC